MSVGAAVALRVKLAAAAPPVRAAAGALWGRPDVATRYLDYLAVMHAVVRASVPLLELAAARCAQRPGTDPVARPLRRYLLAHADEERHHDDWLLADIAAAGGDPVAAAAALPGAAVAAMTGAQYYWIEHHHPVTLLGYVAVLEGHAPAPGLAARLATATGLPSAAFRTLHEHAALDTGHTAELHELVGSLDLTPAQQAAVGVSALHTATGLTRILRDLATPPTHSPGGTP